MGFGAGLTVLGYAIFYWGYHHFTGFNCRYSLWTLLGFDSYNFSKQFVAEHPNVPVQFEGNATTQAITQAQISTNQTTGSPLSSSPISPVVSTSSGGWQSDILAGIGAPQSASNIRKLSAWNQCEGNKGGASGVPINNPFNTTLSCCGGTSVNSAGVKAYPSWSAGLQATVSTLQSGFYVRIVNNLRSDGSFSDFASSVGSSPWGTSGSCIASVLGA